MKNNNGKLTAKEKRAIKKDAQLLEKERFNNYKRMMAKEKIRMQSNLVPPKDPNVLLSLQHVNKVYTTGYVQAVFDFNLDIKKGDFIVLVGPSGCGKSTTIRMIAGLEEITTGDLFINGQYGNNLEPKDRDMAMVFQSYALYPHLTVYDNMAFSLKLRKFPKEEIYERVKQAAIILELDKYLDRKPKELSGGQRQRVALGRAIVRNAKVFLMDEPLSNLDAKLRVQMRSEIVKLHNKLNATTIYVTHDQTEAMSMATRLVVMKDGRVQQVGTPAEIYYKPSNIFVATFIGSPSMNVLETKIINQTFSFGDINYKLTNSEMEQIKQYYNSYSKELNDAIALETSNIKEDIMNDKNIKDKEEALKNLSSHALIELLDKKSKLEKHLGEKELNLLIGIRPERFTELEEKTSSCHVATVDVAEMMGKEFFVYFTVNNKNVIAKIDSKENIAIGDQLFLGVKKEDIYFFDPLTERAIYIK